MEENMSFWTDMWVGNYTLRVSFPRLYSLSTQKEAMVED